MTFKLITFNIADQNIITWTGNKEIDKSTNSLKTRCYQFITNIVKYYDNNITDPTFIEIYTNLTVSSFLTLESLVNNKFIYLQNLHVDDDDIRYPNHGYKALIYYILEFLNHSLITNSMIESYTQNVKLYYFK